MKYYLLQDAGWGNWMLTPFNTKEEAIKYVQYNGCSYNWKIVKELKIIAKEI